MLGRLKWITAAAVALPIIWVRRRLHPGWLQQLAAWDQRSADNASARGDKAAAIAHLERAQSRIERAIRANRGS